MTKSKFTVFCSRKEAQKYKSSGLVPLDGVSVVAVVEKFCRMYGEWWIPVAWEEDCWRAGADVDARRDAAIAAGRVIEFRDGKYIPLGVAEEAPKTAKSRPGIKYICAVPEGLAVTPADLHMVARDQRPPAALVTPKFDPWKGFFTEPADIADWQDTYFPR